MRNKDPATSADTDGLTVIKGTILALYVTEGGTSVYAGLRAALDAKGIASLRIDLLGNASWGTMRGMHTSSEDGQQCFGCLVGDDVVIGFSNALGLAEGDDVWIVAEKMEEKTYQAAAVYRYRDGLVWMHAATKGVGAQLLFLAKCWLAQAGIVLLAAVLFTLRQSPDTRWETLLIVLGVDVAATLLVSLPFFGAILGSAKRAESILKRLGFSDTCWINLAAFQERSAGENVFNLKRAYAATRRPALP